MDGENRFVENAPDPVREEGFFRNILEFVPVPVFYEDAKGRYLGCNKAFEEFTGKPRDKIIAQTVLDVLNGDLSQQSYERDISLLSCGGRMSMEVRLPHSDGTKHDVFMQKGVFCNSDGQVAGLIGAFLDITENKKAQEQERRYRRKLRELASDLATAEEEERRRIAKEIHDSIGQSLALAKIRLQMLAESTSTDEQRASISDVVRTLDETIEYSRSLTADLGLPVLFQLGLEAAAEGLVRTLRVQHALDVRLFFSRLPSSMPDALKVFLYRALRELLMNVVKYAQTDSAVVRAGLSDTNAIALSVTDHGVGFEQETLDTPKTLGGSFGLFALRERVKSLGGRIEIRTAPGMGTNITLTVPQDAFAAQRRETSDTPDSHSTRGRSQDSP